MISPDFTYSVLMVIAEGLWLCDLHDALAAYCSRTGGRLDARAIGAALRKVQGRPVDGRRFKNAGQSHAKVAMWAVERSGVSGVCGVSGVSS